MGFPIRLLIISALVISSLAAALGEPIQRVHLVFSNHLDIGFHSNLPETPGTDANVISHYFRDYFPAAVATAQEMRQRGGPEQYKYLTHSFLVSLYLNDCPGEKLGIYCPTAEEVENLKNAIANGDITWHSYPHNLQTEFISDPDLLQYTVQLSHDLDRQFHLPLKRVISQRDVPGLSRTAIPILSQAGVKAISVGVNSGSAPPGVPKPNKPFLWKDAPSGASVIAFWHPGGYSGDPASGDPLDDADDCVSVPGFNQVLCAAWRTDNAGPHSADEILDIYRRTQANFPQARVVASTYDDFVEELENYLTATNSTNALPVVTQEIGDTWIHGVASDPARVAEFRALVRLRQKIASYIFSSFERNSLRSGGLNNNQAVSASAAFAKFSRLLLKVPEHTWGVDTKEYPGDYSRWSNQDLKQALEDHVPEFDVAVASWQRQRAYTQWAVQELEEIWSDTTLAEHDGNGGEIIYRIRGLLEEYYKETKYLRSIPRTRSGGGVCQPIWHLEQKIKEEEQQQNQDSLENADLVFESHAWRVGLDPSTGAISELVFLFGSDSGSRFSETNDGESNNLLALNSSNAQHQQHVAQQTRWASPESLLGQVLYSTYKEADYDAIWYHYAYRQSPMPDWFYKDFGKPGCGVSGGAQRRDASPKLHSVWQCDANTTGATRTTKYLNSSPSEKQEDGFHVVSKLIFEDESLITDAGAPAAVYVEITSPADSTDLFIDVILENKTATRLPEATWFSWKPAMHAVDSTSWKVSKLGQKISPLEVMTNGSMNMHAVDDNGISVDSACGRAVLNIRSLDAALVSPGKPTPFPMVEDLPELAEGMHFNLHNNIWGTNYVMWWPYQEGDKTIRFRFVVRVEGAKRMPAAAEE